jgi:hypothetical protein
LHVLDMIREAGGWVWLVWSLGIGL